MDSENNQPSNEDNTTPSSTDPKRKKRKGRGSTRLPNVIKDRSSGVKKVIDYDDIGRPKGRNRPQFSSYLGVLARTMVSIEYKDWFEVPEHIKDKLWMMVQEAFIVDPRSRKKVLSSIATCLRTFRRTLTNYIYDHKSDPEILSKPPKAYSFLEQTHWDSFVKRRLAQGFEEFRDTQRERRSCNIYDHRVGRMGYSGLQEKIVAESPEPVQNIERSYMWKMARQNKNGEYDNIDIKKKAAQISKPCRLAVGSINNIVANGTMFEKVGPNELLHTTPLGEANMRVSIEVVKVREALLPIPIPGEATTIGEAVGCHVAWPINLILFAPEVPSKKPGMIGNESKPCRLALGSVDNIVAHGTMFWKSGPNEVLHTTPLGEGNMRVCIDVVKVSNAILPIPIPGEATTVGEAVGCHVAWPKNLIYFAPEVASKKLGITGNKVASKKPARIGNERALNHHGVVDHGVVADEATSKDVEWEKNLETIGLFAIFVKNTSKEDAMIIPLEKDIFGDEVEAHLQKVDMEYICQMKEVSGTCIMLYIRQLYRGIKASNMDRRFVFVNPCLLSGRMVAEELKPGLLAKRLEDVKEDQLLFVPCNFGFHWVLCIIDLYSDSSPIVYLMDSINKDFSLSLKIMINTAFSIYDKAKGRRIRVIPVLKVIECSKQPTNVECGFYVMKYMKDVIKEERILSNGNFKGKRTYTQAEIDEVRVEWINSVVS